MPRECGELHEVGCWITVVAIPSEQPSDGEAVPTGDGSLSRSKSRRATERRGAASLPSSCLAKSFAIATTLDWLKSSQ
jgi:hypothetical protein